MDIITARAIAVSIVELLQPVCTRVEIAGSIRRNKTDVKDIEIVCMPDETQKTRPAFGSKHIAATWFEETLRAWAKRDIWTVLKNGDRYKQFHHLDIGVKLDLFIVRPPADWGVLYTIRTGPAYFSKWIVTPRGYGGALPDYCKVEGGCVYQYDVSSDAPRALEFSEESDFLNFLELGWIEPSKRAARWNAFRKEAA